MGDFNAYMYEHKKRGRARPNRYATQCFSSCLFDCGLTDVGFKGPPFTWEWRDVKERLDRGVSNTAWRVLFPEASILHLPTFKSDHKPLLLSLNFENRVGISNRPFRFLAS